MSQETEFETQEAVAASSKVREMSVPPGDLRRRETTAVAGLLTAVAYLVLPFGHVVSLMLHYFDKSTTSWETLASILATGLASFLSAVSAYRRLERPLVATLIILPISFAYLILVLVWCAKFLLAPP